MRSTLTFPIMTASDLVGTVNMYGRSDNTFVGVPITGLARAMIDLANNDV